MEQQNTENIYHQKKSKTIERRNFLKSGATLGAAMVAAPALSDTGSGEMRKFLYHSAGQSAILKHRTLGSGEYAMNVSAAGLGCMGMSYHRGHVPDRKVAIAMIRKAVELDVTLFDSAEVYGPYVNENLEGEALEPVCKK